VTTICGSKNSGISLGNSAKSSEEKADPKWRRRGRRISVSAMASAAGKITSEGNMAKQYPK